MDFRRSSLSAPVEAVGNPLLWLQQLQQTDVTQVGQRLLSLSQLLHTLPDQAGVPHSFIVPDAAMQAVWRSIDWSSHLLRDFPDLNLNVSPAQALQVQLMAQALQTGILGQTLPPHWAKCWQAGLSHSPASKWRLIPSLWVAPQAGQPQDVAPLLSVQPTLCAATSDALWVGLQTLWASLFQAQQLHIFHHLGLRPAQVHVSILVQPWVAVHTLGWLKVSATSLEIESVTVDETVGATVGGWHGWPAYYCYDRHTQQWCAPLCPAPELETGTDSPPALLSDATLDYLQSVGTAVPHSAYHPHPCTIMWGLVPQSAPQILSLATDLPLPFPALDRKGQPRVFTAPPPALSSAALGDRSVQWTGIGASPGVLTAPVVVIEALEPLSPAVCRGSILVTRHLEPYHLPWLQEALGLLCVEGGQTSHGAILARELGCPAIVGLGESLLEGLHTGQWVVLDGTHGQVQRLAAAPAQRAPFSAVRDGVGRPSVATTTQLLVNVSQPATLNTLHGIDGIGLLRGEWLLLGQRPTLHPPDLSPAQWVDLRQTMADRLLQMAQAIAPRPLFYRSIDWWGEAGQLRLNASAGQNPAIGLRGTLRYQADPQRFEWELTLLADLVQQGVHNIRLVLPFVRSPQEVLYCVEQLHQVGLSPTETLPLWMMAEVPSVLFALEEYQKAGIQGITIGSSDLAQLLLGIDRDHRAFQTVFQQNVSVVLEVVQQLVVRATSLKLPSILCGIVTQQPPTEWLAPLLSAGLTGLSVEVDAIAQMRQTLAQFERSALSL